MLDMYVKLRNLRMSCNGRQHPRPLHVHKIPQDSSHTLNLNGKDRSREKAALSLKPSFPQLNLGYTAPLGVLGALTGLHVALVQSRANIAGKSVRHFSVIGFDPIPIATPFCFVKHVGGKRYRYIRPPI